MSELTRRTRSKSKSKQTILEQDDFENINITEEQCINYFKKYNIIAENISNFSEIDLKKFKSAYRKSTRLFHPDKKKPEEKSKFEKIFEQMETCKEMLNKSFENILSDFFQSLYDSDITRLNFARSIFYSHWVHAGIENKKMDNFRAVVFLEYIVVMKRYLNDGNKKLFIEESKRLSKLFFSSDLRRYFLPEGSKSAKAIVSLSTTALVIHNWVFRQQFEIYVNDIIRTTSIILDIATNNYMALPGMAQKVGEMYSRIKKLGIILPANIITLDGIVSLIINTDAVEEYLNDNSLLNGFKQFTTYIKDNYGIDIFSSQVGYGQKAIIDVGVESIEKNVKEMNILSQLYIVIVVILFTFALVLIGVSNYRSYRQRVRDIAGMIAETTGGESNEETIENSIRQLLQEGVTSPTRPMVRRLSSESIGELFSPSEMQDVELESSSSF